MSNLKKMIWFIMILISIYPLIIKAYPKTHIETAEKLLKSEDYEKIMEQQINASIIAIKRNEPVAASYEKQIRFFYWNAFDHKEIKAILIEFYAENFTEKELQEIIKFNESAVGKKLHAKHTLLNEVLLKHFHERFMLEFEMPKFEKPKRCK